jgi:hypothetical protein
MQSTSETTIENGKCMFNLTFTNPIYAIQYEMSSSAYTIHYTIIQFTCQGDKILRQLATACKRPRLFPGCGDIWRVHQSTTTVSGFLYHLLFLPPTDKEEVQDNPNKLNSRVHPRRYLNSKTKN